MIFVEFNKKMQDCNEQLFSKYNGKKSFVPYRSVNFNNHDNILLMGLNPAGEENHDDFTTFVDYIPSFSIKSPETEKSLKKMTYDKYFKGNYELFNRIKPKMYWINDDTLIASIKMNISPIDHKAFDNMIQNEKIKSQIILTFSDLFCIRQSKAKIVIDYLNQLDKEEVKKHVVNIMNQQIAFYQPKMIVITNVEASNYIREYFLEESQVYDTIKKDDITFIFSGMVTGQRALDRYSKIRLEHAIYQNWIR